jgi:hypothetical protein
MLFVNHPHSSINAWTNLSETWCHGAWIHLSGMLHKSLSAVCMSICIYLHNLVKQQLSKHIPMTLNTSKNRITVGSVILYMVCVISYGVCGSVYTLTTTRKWLSKHILPATKVEGIPAVCALSKKGMLSAIPELVVIITLHQCCVWDSHGGDNNNTVF